MTQVLYRDAASTTGLSLSSGSGAVEVQSVDQLPTHRVERHTFHSADIAAVFVDGLEIGGSRNAVAWSREVDSDDQEVAATWRVRVNVHDHEGCLFEHDLDRRLSDLLEVAGLSCGSSRADFGFQAVPLSGLVEVVGRVGPLWRALQPLLHEVWRERSAVAEIARTKARKESAAARRRTRRNAAS